MLRSMFFNENFSHQLYLCSIKWFSCSSRSYDLNQLIKTCQNDRTHWSEPACFSGCCWSFAGADSALRGNRAETDVGLRVVVEWQRGRICKRRIRSINRPIRGRRRRAGSHLFSVMTPKTTTADVMSWLLRVIGVMQLVFGGNFKLWTSKCFHEDY